MERRMEWKSLKLSTIPAIPQSKQKCRDEHYSQSPRVCQEVPIRPPLSPPYAASEAQQSTATHVVALIADIVSDMVSLLE